MADEQAVLDDDESAPEAAVAVSRGAQPKEAAEPLVLERRWNLAAVARLVELEAGRFPERVVEWKAYVMELEPFVEEDGRVPAHFDGLMAEIFGDLVGDV